MKEEKLTRNRRTLILKSENILFTDLVVKALGLSADSEDTLSDETYGPADHAVDNYNKTDHMYSKCAICQVHCGSLKNLNQHLNGRMHRLYQCLDVFRKHEHHLKQDRAGVKLAAIISTTDEIFQCGKDVDCNIWLKSSDKTKPVVKFILENVGDVDCCLVKRFDLSFTNSFSWNSNIKWPVVIEKGKQLEMQFKLKSSEFGVYTSLVAFKFDSPNIVLVKKIRLQLLDEKLKELEPTSKYQRADVTVIENNFSAIFRGQKLRSSNLLKLESSIQLKAYNMPSTLSSFLNKKLTDGTPLSLPEDFQYFKKPLDESNHRERFHLLLFLEEHQLQLDIRKYDMKAHTGLEAVSRRNYKLKVEGLAEKRPSVLIGDEIFVSFSSEEKQKKKDNAQYLGYVHDVACDFVIINMHSSFCKKWVKGMKLDIRFTFNRLSHRLQHRSIDLALEHSLTHFYLFPQYTDMDPSMEYTKIQQFYNKKIENNEQQVLAINNIMNSTSQDMPFIIFGPPGTGKTSTIVEAIVQIYNRDRNTNILACTPSNRSCDLLVERMLVFGVRPKDVFRMYATSYNIAEIPASIKKCSNVDCNSMFYPTKDELQSNYRIVVCTLATSGRLVSANLESGHFGYVFIDEIGQATEPEALIPLAGICEPDVADVHVVIAGDPKQLGPVLRSTTAIKFGLDTSLLERYMNDFEIYKKFSDDDAEFSSSSESSSGGGSNSNEQQEQRHSHYNNNYIVKLLNNYRCHPSLLHVSNELFYDDELIPSADPVFVGQYLRWEKLPNSAIPLIFHGVRGKDERESTSPSFFNIQEIAQVKSYVDELMTSSLRVNGQDIGVITPYRKQVQKLKQTLKDPRYKDITVASVEEYQGREKKVIIISTVRSTKHFMSYDAKFNVGFLKNPKRFNVAITRCQCLLIVIGDPHLLASDPCWKKLLTYCVTKKCYIGTPFKLSESEEVSDEIEILANHQLDANTTRNINGGDKNGIATTTKDSDSGVDNTIFILNDMFQLFKEMQLEQLASF